METYGDTIYSERSGEILGLSRGLAFLLIGAPVAFVFTLPIAQYMGWFLGSLCHEMGHCLAAWSCGAPSFPAIRLDGHAAAVHGDPHPWLAGVFTVALAAAAYHTFHAGRRLLFVLSVVGAVVLPLLAFTGLRELWFLSMGHGGELIFAAICFHRALSGGFTHQDAERLLYAAVGWYLLGRNVVLFFSLWTDARSRDAYHGSGSFGLENDLIRLARDIDWSLSAVGFLFLVLALLTAPIGMILGRRVQAES